LGKFASVVRLASDAEDADKMMKSPRTCRKHKSYKGELTEFNLISMFRFVMKYQSPWNLTWSTRSRILVQVIPTNCNKFSTSLKVSHVITDFFKSALFMWFEASAIFYTFLNAGSG
jgi:hypothetical protein